MTARRMIRSLEQRAYEEDGKVSESFGLKLKVTERNMMTVTKYMKKQRGKKIFVLCIIDYK